MRKSAFGPNVGSLPHSDTSEVGGEPTCQDSPTDPVDPTETFGRRFNGLSGTATSTACSDQGPLRHLGLCDRFG